MLVDKKHLVRAELNVCPKIVAGRQECIAEKEVWERRSHTKHKGRLIRLQEFPHWIFLFQFSATVLYTRKNVIYSFMLLQALHVEIEMKIFK